ncbi:zinc metalloprotease HtpX [Teichococcus vastitatis]|uniref:zinc metalloprotease HtpX n=1 Tax=Teichococcus vastitatis TaxID=2307076 RepID=UPI00130097A8|nr:zinc metalloprotease HtpX [Pseudoroseomonas vastitatis]
MSRIVTMDPAALRRQLRLNVWQSRLLLLGLSGLAALCGLVLAGVPGLVMAGAAALAVMLLDPAPGGAMFRHVFGGVPLLPQAAPGLHALSGLLAGRAGLGRPPELYLLPGRMLQAMASGSGERSSVALTAGLLRSLPPREIAAVLAHEIAHIRHGDTGVMRVAAAAAALTRAMSLTGLLLLAFWYPILLGTGVSVSPGAILLLMAAPTLGDLLALSLSRRREFLADAGAVELTGDPAALAAALDRLGRLQGDDWEGLARRGGPGWLRWFRTHPTLRERMRRLAEMATIRDPLPAAVLALPTGWAVPERGSLGQRLARHWWF